VTLNSDLPDIVIYTDGACSGNPGPGGFAAIINFQDIKKEISGFELETTNNRMEIKGALEAIKTLKYKCNIEIYTDSKYLQQAMTSWIYSWIENNWIKSDKKPVKNVDLWKELYNETKKHNIIWKWVKGHSENLGNKLADELAVKAKQQAIKILNK
jgi:ribonuclease HI